MQKYKTIYISTDMNKKAHLSLLLTEISSIKKKIYRIITKDFLNNKRYTFKSQHFIATYKQHKSFS